MRLTRKRLLALLILTTAAAVNPAPADPITILTRCPPGAPIGCGWAAEWHPSVESYFAGATSVAVSPDRARVFVTGRSTRQEECCSVSDIVTVSLDAATGSVLWSARHPAARNNGQASDIAVSPDGTRVFVTGSTGPIVTLAYDAANGTSVWTDIFEALGGNSQIPGALSVSGDGSTVYVGGRSELKKWLGNRYASDTFAMALDAATGTRRWFTSYGNGLIASAAAMEVSPAGDTVALAGWISDDDAPLYTDEELLTVLLDARDGSILWTRRHDSGGRDFMTAPSYELGGRYLAFAPDGESLFVAGTFGFTRWVTIELRTDTGQDAWMSQTSAVDEPLIGGYPTAVAVSRDGLTVYVMGLMWKAIVVVALDASDGAEVWRTLLPTDLGFNPHWNLPAQWFPSSLIGAPLASALVVDPESEMLYALAGKNVLDVHGGSDVGVFALTQAHGAITWAGRFDGSPNGGAVHSGCLYVAGRGHSDFENASAIVTSYYTVAAFAMRPFACAA